MVQFFCVFQLNSTFIKYQILFLSKLKLNLYQILSLSKIKFYFYQKSNSISIKKTNSNSIKN